MWEEKSEKLLKLLDTAEKLLIKTISLVGLIKILIEVIGS